MKTFYKLFPLPWKQEGWSIVSSNGDVMADCGYNSYIHACRQAIINCILSNVNKEAK